MQQFPCALREFRFHPSRRWRFDWAWPDKRIALEYEGGVFHGGRHVRGGGYDKDCEKYSTAAILGWVVIRITAKMWEDGRALTLLAQAHVAQLPKEVS
jgi:hypothetical protein